MAEKNTATVRVVNATKCETIDLAVICIDQQTIRHAIVLVKSILQTTQSPVHFHFVTTAMTRLILHRLFATWQLHGCVTSFYSMERLQEMLKWIVDKNNLNSFTELGLPLILPSTLKRIAVLDTKVIFKSDIANVWTVSKTSKSAIIGFVDIGTAFDIDTTDGRRDGPPKNKYFKTGAFLINLDMARSLDWIGVLRDIAEDAHSPQKSTVKPGIKQDKNTDTHHTLQSHEYYTKKYRQILYYDGAVLRREKNHSCFGNKAVSNSQLQTPKPGGCSDFTKRQSIVYRTHLYYTDCMYQSTNYLDVKQSTRQPDVTLVTQLNIDRMQILEKIFKLWDGPASVALYFSDSEMEIFMRMYNSSAVFRHRKNICFHVIYRDSGTYPINYIRNVALDQVQTDYMFLIDVDFLPSHGLHGYLNKAVSTMDMNKTVLIVPGFESLSNETLFPKTKTDLISLWNKKKILQVKVRTWEPGHAAVNYTKWRSATQAYEVAYKLHFEPFLVFHKNTPRFDERFIDYGWDKVSHALLLDARRYKFIVLPTAFIIHMPHPVSEYSKRFKKDRTFTMCWNRLKSTFLTELKNEYAYKIRK